MRKKLAIRGHSTRGNEVIELLEMLGGTNDECHSGTNSWKDEYYCLDNGYIRAYDWCDSIKFTLEGFWEKYPFKVGDKVTLDNKLCSITWMCWECNKIYYQVQGADPLFTKKVTADELKPYKEINTNMNTEFDLTKYSYEVKDGKLVINEKKPKYPKTYDECCNILNADEFVGYELMTNFPKLINARNAFWKIVGEEMGLGKRWEPDYDILNNTNYFTICNFNNKIDKSCTAHRNVILAFPTEEMRDAFYENFRDLIEQCKELL